MDEAQLLFGRSQRLIFQIQLLAVDHAAAARTGSQRPGRPHIDGGRGFDVGDDIKRLGQQDITGQHGRGLAKCLVAGGLAPAQVVVVHARQVIVDQRIAVQHLHGCGKLVGSGGIAVQHIADGQHQHGTDALSAAQQAVAGCTADVRLFGQIGVAGSLQRSIDPHQILLILLCVIH